MKTYNEIVRSLTYLIQSNRGKLADPNYGVSALAGNKYLTHLIRSRADDWMKADQTLGLAMFAAERIEKIALEWLGSIGMEVDQAAKDSLDHPFFDMKAEEFAKHFTVEAISIVWRGPETSSNPLSVMESQFKIEAYKTVMEALTGFGDYTSYFLNFDAISDVFAGKARREAEREEARAKVPYKINMFKGEKGYYTLSIINHRDEVLSTKQLTTTRKNDAKAEAQLFVQNLRPEYRDEHGCLPTMTLNFF